ncbi:MAG TPA: phosphatidylglycerol lysyltransferase domain-containing protein [Candidatus Saccharimonadales bacterium]|nr:phosphatidylglycerol lysyltransferase domain-containing protein [Candidatus Saccharimonadales bacterium]
MHTLPNDTQTGSFKAFPEFSKLTLADRKRYEALIKDYPPVSEIQFPTLMAWWNDLGSCAVSRLNDSIVLSYWFPGKEKATGLSVVGTSGIDEAICTVFDYLRERGDPIRLVHVPEFVLHSVQYPELFIADPERAFDEYIYDISRFYPLSNVPPYRRGRIKKFLAEVGEQHIVLKQLDLASATDRRLLLDRAAAWRKNDPLHLNNIAKLEAEAVGTIIEQGQLMGVENLSIFVDGELQGFCCYRIAEDRRYALLLGFRIGHEIPRLLDYMAYAFARWFADRGVRYVNLDCDLGLPFLRMFKVALGPSNYFRKYTIRPAGDRR